MFQVSWSKIRTWRTCKRSYWYKYNEGLKKKSPPLPLLRGAALGEMLDLRAMKKNGLKALDKYAETYRLLFIEEQEMYGDFIGDLTKIYQGYCETYDKEGFEYTGIELELKVKLTKNIEFVGYIDKIVRDKEKLLWEMDHKSHKNIPGEDQRYADLQQVFYVWGYNQGVKKEKNKLSGVLWDYIRTKPPTVPEQLKNGELSRRANMDTTYSTYLAEIKSLKLDPANYRDILERLKSEPNTFFQRVKLPSSNDAMTKTVVQDMINTAQEIYFVTGVGVLPWTKDQATRSMSNWNCPGCEFFEVCQTELRGYDASFIKKTRYTDREEIADVKIK